MRLLVVEDEMSLAGLVVDRLGRAGFLVDHSACLADATALLAATPFGLVVLDRRLPDGDGIGLLPHIRKRQPAARVLMLTALDAIPDRVAGLNAGADDYLAKPFDVDELIAGVRASLRRRHDNIGQPLTCGRLSFDPHNREAATDGVPILLQRRELALLERLIGRACKVVLRESLHDTLYGLHEAVEPNALDLQISGLRRRLQAIEAGVDVHTVRGVGYMLRAL